MVVMLRRIRYKPVKARKKQPRKTPTQDRLTQRADEIRKRYLVDLVGLVALAGDLDTSVQALRRWMAANGVPIRSKAEARSIRNQAFLASIDGNRDEIIRLRTEYGLKILEIAEVLEVSAKAVGKVLADAELSVPLRTRPPKPPRPPRPLRGVARLDSLRPEVEAAIESGLSARQLAVRFQVAENTVADWLRQTGLKVSPLTEMQRRIISLWKTTDMNMNAIAEALSCSRTNVGAVLRKVGLVDKPTGLGRPPGSAKGKRVSAPPLQQGAA